MSLTCIHDSLHKQSPQRPYRKMKQSVSMKLIASDHENDMYDASNADYVFDECDNEFPDDMKTLPF